MLRVFKVESGSLAERYGLKEEDRIVSINDEKVIDSIDFQALTATRHVRLMVERAGLMLKEIDIIKQPSAPLGIVLDQQAFPPPRECANQCIFCFVDQMPSGMRPSLYIKDDDWRYFLMMGSFVTLTNVGDVEFERLLRRKPSPLYISVQATDAAVRSHLLNNRHAGKLMERLHVLKQHNIRFHCQIVVCPGENDGDVLVQSLTDLYSLRPAAVSIALVPVGLTRYREHLPHVSTANKQHALSVIAACDAFQKKSLKDYGDHFVYVADEYYSIAQMDIPARSYYDDFPQIENGIGMLRLFEDALAEAAAAEKCAAPKRKILVPCGTSVAFFMQKWIDTYAPQHIDVIVHPIINHFFGESVTVTGLITAQDLFAQLKGIDADEVFISETMLNEEGTLFLDDVTWEDFKNTMPIPCRVIRNDGEDFFHALCGQEGNHDQ